MNRKHIVQAENAIYELTILDQGGYTVRKTFTLHPRIKAGGEEFKGTRVVLKPNGSLELWDGPGRVLKTSKVIMIDATP